MKGVVWLLLFSAFLAAAAAVAEKDSQNDGGSSQEKPTHPGCWVFWFLKGCPLAKASDEIIVWKINYFGLMKPFLFRETNCKKKVILLVKP